MMVACDSKRDAHSSVAFPAGFVFNSFLWLKRLNPNSHANFLRYMMGARHCCFLTPGTWPARGFLRTLDFLRLAHRAPESLLRWVTLTGRNSLAAKCWRWCAGLRKPSISL